jgi:hypothetical protein
MMKREHLIEELSENFNLNVHPSEEFNGSIGGIWIRDDICKHETDYYNYAEGTMDEDNVLNQFLSKNGWFAEPYDSETIMIFEI